MADGGLAIPMIRELFKNFIHFPALFPCKKRLSDSPSSGHYLIDAPAG